MASFQSSFHRGMAWLFTDCLTLWAVPTEGILSWVCSRSVVWSYWHTQELISNYKTRWHLINSCRGSTSGTLHMKLASVRALVEIGRKLAVCLCISFWHTPPYRLNHNRVGTPIKFSITASILMTWIQTIATNCKPTDLPSPSLCLKPIDIKSYSHLLLIVWVRRGDDPTFSSELFMNFCHQP